MKITRIWADAAGESHFDSHEIGYVEHRDNAAYSELLAAPGGLAFRVTEPLGDADPQGRWHTAPRRQYVMWLIGETEIEVSDGEKRVLRPGDVLLVEDTHGKGHRNRRLTTEHERWAFVRAEEGV